MDIGHRGHFCINNSGRSRICKSDSFPIHRNQLMIKTQFACTQLFWKLKVLLGITLRNLPFLNWSGITHICNLVRMRKNWIFFFRFYLLNGLVAKSWVSIGLREAVCFMTICWRGGMEISDHICIKSHFQYFWLCSKIRWYRPSTLCVIDQMSRQKRIDSVGSTVCWVCKWQYWLVIGAWWY